MKYLKLCLCVLTLMSVMSLPVMSAGTPADPSLASILKDGLPGIEENQFLQSLQQCPGGSFLLGEEKHGYDPEQPEATGGGWRNLQLVEDETKDTGPQVTTRQMVYENGKGLRVTRVFTFYQAFQAAEYKTWFENVGSDELPMLSDVKPLDLWFPFSAFERLVVHTPGEGENPTTITVFPPREWAITHNKLLSEEGSGVPFNYWAMSTGKELGSFGAHHPMAILEDKGSSDGMFLELGWSGYWQIIFQWVDFTKTPFPLPQTWGGKISDILQISGGMPDGKFLLQPGEKISSPTILLGFYSGGVQRGSNQLRRLKLEHISPAWPASWPEPPILFDYWYDSTALLVEDDFRKLVDRAAELGIECFFIGSEWYPEYSYARKYQRYDSPTDPWSFPVSREIFPSGSLRPLSDYVHSKGMKFGLWFDMARAFDHWPVVREHPEWFWPGPEGPVSPKVVDQVIDLGNPEARAWWHKQMTEAIRRWNVDFIYDDIYSNPERSFSKQDPPGQSGVAQINFIEGMNTFYQELLAEFPELLLLVAGGGDLETFRSTHLTMTGWMAGMGDHARFELAGLNWFYPSRFMQEDLIVYKDSYEEPYPLSYFLSRFPAMLGVGDPIGMWSPETAAQGKQVFEVYKSIRHLFRGDYYPLFEPQPKTLETWDGWQIHDPDTGEGFAVAFRLRYCEEPTATIRLEGLTQSATYQFEDPFTGQQFTIAGQELVKSGLTVGLPKNGAQLLHYTLLEQSPIN